MARLYRDAYGVPHVRGADVLDVAHGQGRAMARDRTWQLEWLRRRALGTTAELVGEPGVAWDRLARGAAIVDVAHRAHAALSEPTRAFLAAYVEGVNGALRDDADELVALGATPQPWEPWMPLATFHAQHVLFGSMGADLWRRHAHAVLGDEAEHLAYDSPALSGSNAWAVGGARTASGLPLIGGDPHRVIEQPGVYAQVRLACDDPDDAFDVVGFCFVGVPGIQHFGHAGDVAWAITNASADHQDGHDEADPPADVVSQHTETIVVRDAEPQTVEVVRTPRGVLLEPGLSLQDAATELGDLGFEALLPLLRARTADDVDRALDHWVEPVNNAVVADVHGVVRYRIAGRVPTRGADGGWTGWLDPVPRHDVGPDGQVVTANERRGPESDAIGSAFAPPWRARRITELLDGRTGLTTADFAAVHDDDLLGTVPLLTSLVPGAFDDFDGRMSADSAGAARFAAWRSALVHRIADQPVFDGLRDAGDAHSSVLAGYFSLVFRVALGLPTLVAAGAPFGLDLRALARAALEDVDAAGGPPSTWGETHVFRPLHAFADLGLDLPVADVPDPPVSGDTDCVRCTSSYPGQTDVCYRGSVARYVWDLADRAAGGWVVPTGASAHGDDPHHHDQTRAWAEGELVPIVTDWARLRLES